MGPRTLPDAAGGAGGHAASRVARPTASGDGAEVPGGLLVAQRADHAVEHGLALVACGRR